MNAVEEEFKQGGPIEAEGNLLSRNVSNTTYISRNNRTVNKLNKLIMFCIQFTIIGSRYCFGGCTGDMETIQSV